MQVASRQMCQINKLVRGTYSLTFVSFLSRGVYTGEALNAIIFAYVNLPQLTSTLGCGPFTNYQPPPVGPDLHLNLVQPA